MAIAMTYDKSTAIRIRDFLVRQGMTIEGAYGMLGNLYAESGFVSNNVQNSYMVNGLTDEIYTAHTDLGIYNGFCTDRIGYGLAQHTSVGRKTALYNYAKSCGVSIGDETMQLNFIMVELNSSYKNVLNILKTSHDIRECAKYVILNYEKPANKSESNQDRRADYAEQLYEDLEKNKGGVAMAYTNSSLVNYVQISPNKTINRTHAIDTITIHCVVGQVTVERLGGIFANASRRASSNYGIGKDGKIGLYVEEKDRSWCSSNTANDDRAITIEVASDTVYPFTVTNKALNSLIELCTDICKRNNISKLVWSANKNERVNHLNGCNMTVHRDYANKSCPGDYLYNKHSYIANEVNKRLTPTIPASPSANISVNQFVPTMGDTTDFANIVKNLKLALNTDYGLAFDTTSSAIDDILLINLGNVVLSTTSYVSNVTYVLQQLFTWWGYPNITLDGIYGSGTQSTVILFQSQVGIAQTGTTTKEFWYKILGK